MTSLSSPIEKHPRPIIPCKEGDVRQSNGIAPVGNPASAIPLKTGWPAPELAQDDHRKLFAWFASRLDSRQRVREACSDIASTKETA